MPKNYYFTIFYEKNIQIKCACENKKQLRKIIKCELEILIFQKLTSNDLYIEIIQDFH